MENQIALFACRCWNGYLKPFFIAALLGILAGACFGSLAHGAPSGNARPLGESAGVPTQIASAGRIRQQAQRIAKLYQQIGMGLEAERARRQVVQARRQMDIDVSGLMRLSLTEKYRSSALNELATAPENSEANRRTLDLAKVQWFFFEQSISRMKDRESSNLQNVATSSERILEVLDELSMQYARTGEAPAPARSERSS